MKFSEEELIGVKRNLECVTYTSVWCELHIKNKCIRSVVSIRKKERLFTGKFSYYAKWSVQGGDEVMLEDAEEVYNYCTKVASEHEEKLLQKRELQRENQMRLARESLLI